MTLPFVPTSYLTMNYCANCTAGKDNKATSGLQSDPNAANSANIPSPFWSRESSTLLAKYTKNYSGLKIRTEEECCSTSNPFVVHTVVDRLEVEMLRRRGAAPTDASASKGPSDVVLKVASARMRPPRIRQHPTDVFFSLQYDSAASLG